jgi:hypothetical protein
MLPRAGRAAPTTERHSDEQDMGRHGRARAMSHAERSPKTRGVISSTCTVHPGPAGFCNLEVYSDGQDIVLKPHATGACVIRLNEAEARGLLAWIGELLG